MQSSDVELGALRATELRPWEPNVRHTAANPRACATKSPTAGIFACDFIWR
jgi:hypothetical protein